VRADEVLDALHGEPRAAGRQEECLLARVVDAFLPDVDPALRDDGAQVARCLDPLDPSFVTCIRSLRPENPVKRGDSKE
jgi:hypothetical protein